MKNGAGDWFVIKAVLVDLDDTLYAYSPCCNAGISKAIVFAAKNYGISQEDALAFFSKARDEAKITAGKTGAAHSRLLYFKRMGEIIEGKTNLDFAINAEKRFWKAYFGKMVLKPPAKEFLANCKKASLKVAVVTNLTTEIQFRKIKTLGIKKFIDFIVTSEEAGSEKPDKKIVALALERLGVSVSEVIFVGDKDDCEIPLKTGIDFYPAEKDSDWVKLNFFVKSL